VGSDQRFGRGLFIVEGDLEVQDNMQYGAGNVATMDRLASVGWFIKGSVIVDPSVGEMVGAFVLLGCEAAPGNCNGAPAPLRKHNGTFSTGDSSSTTLYVRGLTMAKAYNFQREVTSADVGSEVFISNGRERANTPPGMSSIAQALPKDISSVHPE